jgi:hypothetical protein
VLTVMLPMPPVVPGGSPLVIDGSGLGLPVVPPAGVNGIGLELSPSPHAMIVKGTAKDETTNKRLPNIVIHLLYHGPERRAFAPNRLHAAAHCVGE